MKTMTKTILGALLLSAFTCAHADVIQAWKCTLNDGKTDADIEQASSAWLAAAKSMQGGADLKVYHNYALAANSGAGGFMFILIAPDIATWGAFMNGYPGSAAAKADADWNNVAACSGSSLWNSTEIK